MDKHEAERLVEEYGDMVFRLAYAKTGNRQDAEDVTQEVFLRLLRKAPEHFNSGDHAKHWLLRVTLQRANDLFRARARRRELPLEAAEELKAQEREEPGETLAAVMTLPEELRIPIHLLSDEPVELSFSADEGYQTAVELDKDITFNYLGDCAAHITKADISALRLRLAFDQMERAGQGLEHWEDKATPWSILERDGTRVPLSYPLIREDVETGAGYIRMEGVDENNNRRLIDPAQAEALLIGGAYIPLQ